MVIIKILPKLKLLVKDSVSSQVFGLNYFQILSHFDNGLNFPSGRWQEYRVPKFISLPKYLEGGEENTDLNEKIRSTDSTWHGCIAVLPLSDTRRSSFLTTLLTPTESTPGFRSLLHTVLWEIVTGRMDWTWR